LEDDYKNAVTLNSYHNLLGYVTM